MVAAMMWPLVAPARRGEPGGVPDVARPAGGDLRGRDHRAVGRHGLAVATVAHLLAVPAGNRAWQIDWVGVALLAGRSARRARVLWRCAKIPAVAPGGVRGLASASIAGAVAWRRCALLCGPVMAAMVVSHDPVLMLGASLAAWWEAAHPRAWRDPVPTLLLAAVAGWLLLLLVVEAG